jgi:HEAT repeat protein
VAPSAAAALAEALASADDRGRVILATHLSTLGPAAAPALAQALKADTPEVRVAAARLLGDGCGKVPPAEHALRTALHDVDSRVAAAAAQALFLIRGESQEVMEALRTALASPHDGARLTAATTLRTMGAAAAPAAPALRRALHDANPKVREEVFTALAATREHARDAVPDMLARVRHEPDESALVLLLEGLSELAAAGVETDIIRGPLTHLARDPREPVRAAAAHGLGLLTGREATTVPLLLDLLADPGPDVADAAADALKKLGPAGVSALADGLHHPGADVREGAAAALAHLRAAAAPAVPALLTALDDADDAVRRAVIMTLASVGPKARPAARKLAEIMLRDPDETVRRDAACALGAWKPCDRETAAALAVAMGDESDMVSETAVKAATELLPDDVLLRGLAAAVTDTRPAISSEAANALGQCGAEGRRLLVELLAHRQGATRSAAVLALRGAGPDAVDAVPALTAALKDADAELRGEIVHALRRIGAAGAEWRATLERMLRADERPENRGAAAAALGALGGRDAKAALRERLEAENDAGVRQSIASSLAALRRAETDRGEKR